MGLAGRKIKQRIPNDPRNLSWSENAAKFGHTYLAKLGWNPTLGLGLTGDGRTTNIAVAQKLDQLGIGAGRGGNDKDGIAWRQQNDFERMLARLNSQTSDTPSANAGPGAVAALGFVTPTPTGSEAPLVNSASQCSTNDDELPSNKRKRKRCQSEAGQHLVDEIADVPVSAPPRRFAHHRARLLNSKKISAQSASELSEVLGVSASASATPSGRSSPTPGETPGTLTPISDTKITTSAISMSAYFKEKMQKMENRNKWMARPKEPNEPKPGIPETKLPHEDESELPRLGLGARRADLPPAITQSPLPATEAIASNLPASFVQASDFIPTRELGDMDTGACQLIVPEAVLTHSTDSLTSKEKKKRRDSKHSKPAEPVGHATDQMPVDSSMNDEGIRRRKKKSNLEGTLDGDDRDRKAEKRKRREEKKAKKRMKNGEV